MGDSLTVEMVLMRTWPSFGEGIGRVHGMIGFPMKNK